MHYQTLCDDCNLRLNMKENPHDRLEIGKILGAISTHEHAKERPLLSALVVSAGSFDEGDGFYKLCEELGYGEWRSLKRNERFAFDRMEECWHFWQNDNNYVQHRGD